MSERNGGSAFPVIRTEPKEDRGDLYPHVYSRGGMTLRDYFAAKAMQGILAYPGDETGGSAHNNSTSDQIADMAYRQADAMLLVRGETP